MPSCGTSSPHPPYPLSRSTAINYHIYRNGQTYGPYTLADLRRYLATGNVLPTDLAKSDDMPDYVPVTQIVAPPPPPLPYPVSVPPSTYPDPPDLHWGLVLLITIFTNGIFLIVWEFIVVVWLKKVQPETKALKQYILGYSLVLAGVIVFLAGIGIVFASRAGQDIVPGPFIAVGAASWLFYMAGVIITIVARFTEKASLEAHFNGPEPIGLRLSGVMTFFFGTLYFQYHLNRIHQAKQLARYMPHRPY